MSVAVAMSLAGLSLVLVSWAHHLWLTSRKRAPARPLGHLAGMALGSALAVVGLLEGGSDLAPMVVSIIATSLALLFVFWLSRARVAASRAPSARGD